MLEYTLFMEWTQLIECDTLTPPKRHISLIIAEFPLNTVHVVWW